MARGAARPNFSDGGAAAALERLFSVPQSHAALFEDRVYGFNDWEKHRSAAWRHRIEPLVCLRVAVGFVWQLVLVALVSVGVGLVATFLPSDKILDDAHFTLPYTMMTFALSLLLVFKTNSSYARWWEGRIIWGQVVNFARNYARMAALWFPRDRPELAAAALRWAAVSPRVLLAHIRQGADVEDEVRGLLLPSETAWLLGWSNRPLGAGAALARLAADAALPDQLQVELQRQVEVYCNMAGGCERILKTPIPPAYTRHTSRFLLLYLITSPLLLWPSTGWATPAVAVGIAFLLLGVENIGVQVEEPFHVLPLYDICRAIEANVKELERSLLHEPYAAPIPQHQPPAVRGHSTAGAAHAEDVGTADGSCSGGAAGAGGLSRAQGLDRSGRHALELRSLAPSAGPLPEAAAAAAALGLGLVADGSGRGGAAAGPCAGPRRGADVRGTAEEAVCNDRR